MLYKYLFIIVELGKMAVRDLYFKMYGCSQDA